MKYFIDKQEKYSLISLEEDQLDAAVAPEVKSEFVKLNAEGYKNIIFDLHKVRYADSSGLSAILVGNRICNEDNGIFVIANASEMVQKLINISQLQNILHLLPTVAEAIDAVFINELENELGVEPEAEL